MIGAWFKLDIQALRFKSVTRVGPSRLLWPVALIKFQP
jgi:hypothetical protein